MNQWVQETHGEDYKTITVDFGWCAFITMVLQYVKHQHDIRGSSVPETLLWVDNSLAEAHCSWVNERKIASIQLVNNKSNVAVVSV